MFTFKKESGITIGAVLKRMRERIRMLVMGVRIGYLVKLWGFDIATSARISFSAFLDKTCPELISIGDKSLVARGAVILSHDFSRGVRLPTRIGRNCLIGANSIVLPGVTIGDCVVVGAGAVVTQDVEANCLVAGNPARVLRAIRTTDYGRIIAS